MFSIIKKGFILSLFIGLVFSITYAATSNTKNRVGSIEITNPYIENVRLSSPRFTQPEDERLVDPEHYVDLTNRDVLILENTHFALYMNDRNNSFKILNKHTNYVWNTIIDNVRAGEYNGLLSSVVGFDYFYVPTDISLNRNIGINDTVYDVDIHVSGNTVTLDFMVGGFCETFWCENNYHRYVAGEEGYDLETMIERGFRQLDFELSLEVTLTNQGVSARIPYDSIVEHSPELIKISSLTIFPGLGATKLDDIPGYMVIPDGVGALIRYVDKEGRYGNPFIERFYGENRSNLITPTSVLDYPLSMPIYGAVHGVHQNAFIAIIESGAINARLLAYPNGADNTDYNLIFSKFDYLQRYRQSFTSDGTGGPRRIHQASQEDVVIRYNFLHDDDADYVGMAQNYQSFLVEQGHLMPLQDTRDNIPIHLRYLMADSKQQFIGKSVVEMTSMADVKAMYDYFYDAGLTHQKVSLMGWNRGGYSGQLPTAVNVERRLTSELKLDELSRHIGEENTLMLVNNYIHATEATRRISYRNDVALGINRFNLEHECERCVYSNRYRLYPESTHRLAMRDLDDYKALGVEVLFESTASTLFSYYDREQFMRTEALAYYQDIFEAYQDTANYTYPSAYAYSYSQDFYEAPLFNSQLNYYDDMIPFLPIVLSGYMNLYSPFLNFNSLGRQQILMLIDFGINPSFILTQKRPSALIGTDIEHVYTAQFDMWVDAIEVEYAFINRALSHVINSSIVSREVLDKGVVKVTYSNDVYFVINYTESSYLYKTQPVVPLSYIIGGVEK